MCSHYRPDDNQNFWAETLADPCTVSAAASAIHIVRVTSLKSKGKRAAFLVAQLLEPYTHLEFRGPYVTSPREWITKLPFSGNRRPERAEILDMELHRNKAPIRKTITERVTLDIWYDLDAKQAPNRPADQTYLINVSVQ
jgi:hypothetical protein